MNPATAPSKLPRLVLSRLNRTFNGRGGVNDVSLTVPQGAIYALCGVNGSGKTTTLSVLAGLRFANHGTLFIDGMPVPLHTPVQRVGCSLVTDTPVFDDGLTGWQWAAYVAGLKEVAWSSAHASAVAATLTLPLSSLDQSLATLSFGTRRKVVLWVEFSTTTRVLMMDEPLIGLDPPTIEGVHQLAREFVADGRSIVLSTHFLREAERLATHVGVIHDGKTLVDGPMADVCGNTTLSERFASLVRDPA